MLLEFYQKKQKISKMSIIKEFHFFNQVDPHDHILDNLYSMLLLLKLILGTGKKSWMNDQLVHELEKRGLRRSRGIKRIISTHKKRMGFMFTISLAFIISGMLSNCATAIQFFISWLSIQYLKSVIFFMANPTRVFYHSLYHYVCLPQTRKSPILPKIGSPFSPHIIINLDHSWR